MTWFSSGLSNLKEQFNLLITEEENLWENGPEKNNTRLPEQVDNLLNSKEQLNEKKSEITREESLPSVNIPKYLTTLDNCLQDVNLLNDYINGTSTEIVTILQEYESMRNELRTLKKERQISTKEIESNVDSSLETENPWMKENHALKERCGDLETDNSNLVEALNMMKISLNQSQKEIECLNEKIREKNETQVKEEREIFFEDRNKSDSKSSSRCDNVFTKQVDDLILVADDIKKEESNLRKKIRDTLKNNPSEVEFAEEYFSLAEKDRNTWEEFKMSFVLPILTVLKQSQISEMSVSDSLKEALKSVVSVTEESRSSTGVENVEIDSQKHKINEEPAYAKEPQTVCSNSKNENTELELERLREHLLAVEQAYTNELLQCENRNKILQDQLNDYEVKFNAMVESCTSSNIRVNQITESLQKEVKSLTEENDKLKDNLMYCQKELQKNAEDAFNLRSALDLFYKNKDTEILQATEKLRNDMINIQHENIALRETVNSLYSNMNAVKEQSVEKEILLETLHAKDEEIRNLQTEVGNVQRELQNARNKIADLMAESEAKLKINLIKNMIFRYLASDSQNTRLQSLRILDNVLDFNEYEKQKIGLSKSTSNLKSEKYAANDSLINEFIKFVEKESNPSTKIGKKNNELVYGKLTTSLSSPLNVPLTAPRAYTDNSRSSSILKDALHCDEN